MPIVEKFIFEQLNVTKVLISETKNIQSIASEVQKVAEEVLYAVVRLCKAYSEALHSEKDKVGIEEGVSMHSENIDDVNHASNITTCAIASLYGLGILAAGGGGSLVTILRASWRSVVSLLQLVNGDLAANINVADIILTLISLATESLRCAAESCSKLKETIPMKEAKRPFYPVKFYLIHAVRILSRYPHLAFTIYREISVPVLMVSTFGTLLSQEAHLKTSREALTLILEPTSSLLLHTLVNSVIVHESKVQILDWLFTDEDHSTLNPENINRNPSCSMLEIFNLDCEAMPRARTLMSGRVLLFLDLLRNSSDLGEDVRLGLSRKLAWFLYCLQDEEIYSSVLAMHSPVLCSSEPGLEIVWQDLFSSILSALKTFMIVASSSSSWGMVEIFLLQNIPHPHFLVWEIILELWCFFVRYAEMEKLNYTIGKVFSLFRSMVSSKLVLLPNSPLRKTAKLICTLLTYATEPVMDQVYSSIIADGKSLSSSIMYVTLLMERFPLNLLSDSLKNLAVQRVTTSYCSYLETDLERLQVDSNSRSCSSYVLGEPVYALSSALRCLQISSSNVDCKTLKFAVAVISGCRSATDSSRDTYCDLLSEVLVIISKTTHLYLSIEMEEVIMELQTLFSIAPEALDVYLSRCKPDLALFMAGVGHMQIVEVEGSPMATALFELYHMLLREKHWALVHLAITAFGYFAAYTSLNELWKFVPQNAALSFDIERGSKIDEKKFMSEFTVFLKKEGALKVVAQSTKELSLLAREGSKLKETASIVSSICLEDQKADMMEIDQENQVTKKRKLPDEINEGMSILQSGLKVMGDGLAQWQKEQANSTALQKFFTQFSCLEDVIAHLVSLAGSS